MPHEPATGTRAPDDPFAAELRGLGPSGLVALLVILAGNLLFLPLSALLVLLWAWRSRTPWTAIGFVREKHRPALVVLGIVTGVAFKLVMKALVMPLLGADPVNHAYHYLAGNRAALPGAIYLMIAGAGFGEETLFRGYLFERLGRLVGSGRLARIAIVLISSTLFAAAHYSTQGLPGVEQAAVTGLVFGSIYTSTGSLLLPMVMHAAFDLTALAIIYSDLEMRVAHWVFR